MVEDLLQDLNKIPPGHQTSAVNACKRLGNTITGKLRSLRDRSTTISPEEAEYITDMTNAGIGQLILTIGQIERMERGGIG